MPVCCDLGNSVLHEWSKIPYPGETSHLVPVEPNAGSWPTYFIKHDNKNGGFMDDKGKHINLDIQHPGTIDFGKQLDIVREALDFNTSRRLQIARYWGEGVATKQWTPIIDMLIDGYKLEAPRAARVLAEVYAGINDAFVVCWYLKYLWGVARPIQLDRQLRTVLPTPLHPSYPSGHATISGCAQVILSYFFKPQARRLKELAEENAMSRLYAGVHFPADNSEGIKLGRQIGREVVKQLEKQRDASGNRVDITITETINLNLIPPPYKQVIPFTLTK